RALSASATPVLRVVLPAPERPVSQMVKPVLMTCPSRGCSLANVRRDHGRVGRPRSRRSQCGLARRLWRGEVSLRPAEQDLMDHTLRIGAEEGRIEDT